MTRYLRTVLPSLNTFLHYLCAALFAGMLVVPLAPRVYAQDEPQAVTLFEPVRGNLTDRITANEWTFEARAGQVVSVLARRLSGDLDPTLVVLGPSGELIAENDDRDSLVTDAGLEALSLPTEGTYTFRVERYQGDEGTTTGEYELAVTPGFGQVARQDTFEGEESPWQVPGGDLVSLTQERLRLRAFRSGGQIVAIPSDADPLSDLYVQVEAELSGAQSYAEFGLVFRAQRLQGGVQGYQFKVNTEGNWSVVVADAAGTTLLQEWTPNPALDASEWTLAVLARGSTLSFWGNGALLGSVNNEQLTDPGAIGLVAATRPDQGDPATVLFDNVIVTTRLVTTYRGLPLVLATWATRDPARIVNELAASGAVQAAPSRSLFVPQATLRVLDQVSHFDFLGAEDAVFADFVLGATFNIVSNGESVACGLTFRWQDDRNLSVAYLDTVGGFGLAQSRDAELVVNLYDHSQMVIEDSNVLLVVAQGDRVGLYVNGALVAEEPVEAGEGRVGTALLNYEDAGTDCYFLDLWVWPLQAE